MIGSSTLLAANSISTHDQSLNLSEQVLDCCHIAQQLRDQGDYEAACASVSEWWDGNIGERPRLDGLNALASAELLLRCGVLAGWLGSARAITNAQEFAKDLISEALHGFQMQVNSEKVAEAQTEIAYCCWREGSFDEARLMLQNVIERFNLFDSELRARAVLRLATVERSANHFQEAFALLNTEARLFENIANNTLKGGYHNELAVVLNKLGASGHRRDFIDRALIEFAAASFFWEQAGHERHCARVENNLGLLYISIGRFSEAHEHLNHARLLFSHLEDAGHIAQVDETRARTFLGEGRLIEAEVTARSSVYTLEDTDEQGLLAEALTTHGVALARLSYHEQAYATLERAVNIAEITGDNEGAARAALTIIEELHEHINSLLLRVWYDRAHNFLAANSVVSSPTASTLR